MITATGDQWLSSLAALRRRPPFAERCEEVFSDLETDVEKLEQRLRAKAGEPIAFEDVLPLEGKRLYRLGQYTLLTMLLARELPSFRASGETVTGDLELEADETRTVTGDLRVTGNLKVAGTLLVFGSLEVGGYHNDLYSAIATVVVGGDMRCGQHCLTEGFLSVGGELSAPLVFFSFNQGFGKVLGGLKAKLLLEFNHGPSRVFGPVGAPLIVTDELRIDEPAQPTDVEEHWSELEALLLPQISAKVEEKDVRHVNDAVYEAAKRGKPVLR
jgi:hypothetical protein